MEQTEHAEIAARLGFTFEPRHDGDLYVSYAAGGGHMASSTERKLWNEITRLEAERDAKDELIARLREAGHSLHIAILARMGDRAATEHDKATCPWCTAYAAATPTATAREGDEG